MHTVADEAKTRPVTVAVVGLGPIGRLHASVYAGYEGCRLVAVCDLDSGRLDAARADLGVPGYTRLEDLLAEVRPEVVSVATGGVEYGSDHRLPTIQALEAGCHVLVEKPISNEIGPAREMVATAGRLGRRLGVNLNHRFTDLARTAHRWVCEGRLGDLLFCNMSMWIGNPQESSPWFHLKALHPHTIDVMRYFCGDIEAVQCFATRAPGRTIWSTAHLSMRFASGAVGGLTGSYDIDRGHPMERCEVAGTRGRFVLTDMFDELTLYPGESAEKTVITGNMWSGAPRVFADTFKDRLRRFVDQVAAGVSPDQIDGSGRDGLAAQLVIDAAIRSVQEGGTLQHVEPL